MSVAALTLIFFGSLFIGILAGVPVAIVLGGFSVVFCYFFWGPAALSMLVLKAFEALTSFSYAAVPLFIIMAYMLERSGVAEDLFDAISRRFRRVPGGLAAGVIVICAIFAAMAGISAAATVTMGVVALPAMLDRGYEKSIALGSIAGGGLLGILIPPSITMIIYGLEANTSIGRLYMGGIIPGLVIAGIFISYIVLRCTINPTLAPSSESREWTQGRVERGKTFWSLLLCALIVGTVLSSIIFGVVSITESAAVGAALSAVVVLIKRGLDWHVFWSSTEKTLLLSCFIFWIVIGASGFSTLYTAIGAENWMRELIEGWDVNRYVILSAIVLVLIILGMFIDSTGIIMITVPILIPIIDTLGFDRVWFGVIFIVVMEIGFLTPPFGANIFYLKGVAPSNIMIEDIYRATGPYIFLLILAIIIFTIFPSIITVFPDYVFGGR